MYAIMTCYVVSSYVLLCHIGLDAAEGHGGHGRRRGPLTGPVAGARMI